MWARIFFTLSVFLCCCSGCSTSSSEAVELDPYENAILVELAGAPSTPAPVTPVSSKHKRADCPDGGWVGDGTVRTRCLNCEPAYTQEEASAEKPVVPFGGSVTPIAIRSEELKALIEPMRDELVSAPPEPIQSSASTSCSTGSCAPAASPASQSYRGAARRTGPIRRFFSRVRRR